MPPGHTTAVSRWTTSVNRLCSWTNRCKRSAQEGGGLTAAVFVRSDNCTPRPTRFNPLNTKMKLSCILSFSSYRAVNIHCLSCQNTDTYTPCRSPQPSKALSLLSKFQTVSWYTRACEFVTAHNQARPGLPCAHFRTTCVLCTALIPDLTYIARHCADLHLTHSCSATFRLRVLC